ncbi:MAG: hypothetical protein LBJ67_07135 [Planctomycetaceae bacterium]|jgi:uncharacterized protein YfbU (UPF0304 family)|nr:hypothetical protein [Planctomycetaceae bacterium]
MDSLYLEQAYEPARVLSMYELAESYFQHRQHQNSRDVSNIKKAFELLAESYPNADTANFVAADLIDYQQYLVYKGYARSYCNKLINFFRSVLKWGVLYQLVSPALTYSLKCVPSLQYGTARENKPREDIPVTR